MLVYIEVASAVNNFALGGIVEGSDDIKSVVLLTYDDSLLMIGFN